MLMLALATQPAFGGTPQWTATGGVTALGKRSITVHGQTCRITTASPPSATLRLYHVGAEARIACKKGILKTISPLRASTVPVQSGGLGGSSVTFVAPTCGKAPN